MEQTKSVKDAIHGARETIEKAREQTVEAASRVIEKGEQAWNDVRHRGEEVLETAQKRGKEIWDDVAEQGSEGVVLARRYVRKNPGRAIGIALVAGVVLGALLFSGSSKDE